MSSSIADLFTSVQTATAWVDEFLQKHGDELVGIAIEFDQIDRLDKIGWLPHQAVQLPPLRAAFDDIEATVEHCYRQASPDIERDLHASLEASQFAKIVRDPLEEAILAHQQGRFRSTVRLVFPALEAMVRREILGDRWGANTKWPELRKRMADYDLAALCPPPRLKNFKLFEKLEEHLFEQVDTADAFDRFCASGIPNRHACVHGVIDYHTFQHSLNSLIIAVYALKMTLLVKSGA